MHVEITTMIQGPGVKIIRIRKMVLRFILQGPLNEI